MVSLHGESGGVIARFADEPKPAGLRADLATGVMVDANQLQRAAPGSLEVWTLPADHDGTGLPVPERPLVLVLRPPRDWLFDRPDPELFAEVFLSGAERLAGALRPALILPFPDPDAEAPLTLDGTVEPEQWRGWYESARELVTAASPSTRIGVRLGGTGERSAALFEALARAPSPVDVAGPRLHPGNVARGGPAFADEILATWRGWRAGVASPPELWVLAAGCSPLAYGERAQARFVDGCLARASADPEVAGILIQGWRDRGHTLGLLRPDGSPREAGSLVLMRLPPPPAPMSPAPNR
jgi:hypothetical protein